MNSKERVSLANDVAALLIAAGSAKALATGEVKRAHDQIHANLVDTFTEALAPLEDLATKGPAEQNAVITALVRAVAGLQADVLALKAERLGGSIDSLPDTSILSQIAELRTPKSAAAVDVTIDLSPRILGHGWYIEDHGDGRYWRWLGPRAEGALVIPAFGPGTYVVTTTLTAMKPEQLSTIRLSVNGQPLSLQLGKVQGRSAPARFAFKIGERESNFLFLQFEIDRLYSPQEIDGGEDQRMLGFGLASLRIQRAAPSAG